MNIATSTPDRYVVAGNPIAHSQSPFIHAQFAQATGQAIDYGRLLCPTEPPGTFAATLHAFAASGEAGTGRACGCNVTVPFKFDAFRLAARHTARAMLAQAANTLRFDNEASGGWLADNTDGAGLVRDIEHNAGVAIGGRRVLLIGAGGAAAGAVGPLVGARPALLTVANRTLERAVALVARHVQLAAVHGVLLQPATLAEPGDGYDIVVNASASSLQGLPVPVPASALGAGALALDMMYGPPAQPFLDWAARNGARGRDGLGMLVEQASEAFLLWRGVRPATTAVLVALRERMAAK